MMDEADEEPIYEDQSLGDDEDHIYEDFDRVAPRNEKPRTPRTTQPSQKQADKKRVDLTLSRTLGGVVKEKVENYESIAAGGAKVVINCPDELGASVATCPDPSASFQIKSGSGVSDASRSPFNL